MRDILVHHLILELRKVRLVKILIEIPRKFIRFIIILTSKD